MIICPMAFVKISALTQNLSLMAECQVRAPIPSLPTSFPQFHFSEIDYLYQLFRGDLPFAEVMATNEKNNSDKLVGISKLSICINKKKYTDYENWFC